MSSKRVALPSLNSTSKKDALKPVKVQRYRAGQVPEGYVDPALESSDDEEEETAATGRGGLAKAGRINVSIAQDEQPRVAYQVLNVEQMTKQRQLERVTSSGTAASAEGDRRLARLQAIHLEDRRSRGDTKSRRRREDSDDSDEQDKDEAQGEEEDDEEAAARRREAARARAMRGDDEQELWEQGEEEEEEEDHADRKSRAKRDGEESEGSSEYTSGSEEESEDEIASRRKLMKPVFVPKSQRITIDEVKNPDVAFELAEKARLEAIEERKKESHELLKQYIARQAEVEEVPDTDNLEDVDDTDGLDEEAEFEQWKLRELKRIKRDREELEAREAEKAEIERRRELTEEERVKEDMAYLAKKAKEEQANKKSAVVEKYHHKGAFFMDSDEAILKRSTAEATPDAIKNIKALPKIMQVRNFGRAGQTKYTTLKDQDTSQRSGWTDPMSRNLIQRHRMGGLRGEDVKIASKMNRRDGGGRGQGRGEKENANNMQLGSRSDHYSGSRHYRDNDRSRDRDRDRGRDSGSSSRGNSGRDRDRYSERSSSSYHDRDRDRDRDRSRVESEPSKRRRY